MVHNTLGSILGPLIVGSSHFCLCNARAQRVHVAERYASGLQGGTAMLHEYIFPSARSCSDQIQEHLMTTNTHPGCRAAMSTRPQSSCNMPNSRDFVEQTKFTCLFNIGSNSPEGPMPNKEYLAPTLIANPFTKTQSLRGLINLALGLSLPSGRNDP